MGGAGMNSPYSRLAKPKALSPGEELLALHIRAAKLPEPAREFIFHPTRNFRFDFCWPDERYRLAVEINGGNRLATIGRDGKPYAVGRHTQDKDLTKLNEAVLLGYRVLTFTPDMVKSGEAIQIIERALKL